MLRMFFFLSPLNSTLDSQLEHTQLSTKPNKVTLFWVLGYEGIPISQKPDELFGFDAEIIGPESKFGTCKSSRKSISEKTLNYLD